MSGSTRRTVRGLRAAPWVLVLDADASRREALSLAIRGLGMDAVEARNGWEVLNHLSHALRDSEGDDVPAAVLVVPRRNDRTPDGLCQFFSREWNVPVFALTHELGDDPSERLSMMGAERIETDPTDVKRIAQHVVGRLKKPA